jgi:hypothetical protein
MIRTSNTSSEQLTKLVAEGWAIHGRASNGSVDQATAFRWKFAVLRELRVSQPEAYKTFGRLTERVLLRPANFHRALKFIQDLL